MVRSILSFIIGVYVGIFLMCLLRVAREEERKYMYEVTYTIDGIIKKININAKDAFQAQEIFTNMYGMGKIQIINIRRK